MKKEDIKKVVLAYSGGLDTSIIIPWLKEHYNNCEVIAVSGNVGQADELDGLEEKAIKTGASKLYVLDLTDEYVDDYIIPTMQAGAMYEEYLLGTSHARPCIAKGLVEIAQKEGADALAHGVKKLSVARDEASKRSIRALLELRKRVQQEEKPLFLRIARHCEKDEAAFRQRELRSDDVSPRRQGLRRNAVEDHTDLLFFDAVFAQKVRPLRTNRDARGIVRCDTPVDGTPEEALAHRKMAREHDARLPPPEA